VSKVIDGTVVGQEGIGSATLDEIATTNVTESPFATVRLRQPVTKGAGNRTKALTMAFKLLDMAQQRWRRLDGSHLLPLVRAGVKFVDGAQIKRPNEEEDRKEAA
jgi:hypothetical protein